MKYCWVIPHYNHSAEFIQFLPRLLETALPAIIVDDGSDIEHVLALESVLKDTSSMHLFKHESNRGKGAAVISACYFARSLGFTHIIQIDADGQHQASDYKTFIAASQLQPEAIISGYPVFDDTVPSVRKYGRKITTFFVALETLSVQIKDALCGYRVYPLASTERLLDNYHIGTHMDFDTDIIVKAVWANIPVQFIATEVRYRQGGTSHFHYFTDNRRLIALHTRLLLQASLRVPMMYLRRILPR